jgi:hypothetical protein
MRVKSPLYVVLTMAVSWSGCGDGSRSRITGPAAISTPAVVATVSSPTPSPSSSPNSPNNGNSPNSPNPNDPGSSNPPSNHTPATPAANQPPVMNGGGSVTVPVAGVAILTADVNDPDGDKVSCTFEPDHCVGLSSGSTALPRPTAAVMLQGCDNGNVGLVCVDARGASNQVGWQLRR